MRVSMDNGYKLEPSHEHGYMITVYKGSGSVHNVYQVPTVGQAVKSIRESARKTKRAHYVELDSYSKLVIALDNSGKGERISKYIIEPLNHTQTKENSKDRKSLTPLLTAVAVAILCGIALGKYL